MQPPTPAAESPAVPWLRRLLRPKFSLRTLLLGMAVLGAGLGLFQRLDHQRQLVARIKAAGGRCIYRLEFDRYNEPWLIRRLPQCYFDDVCSVRFDENSESVDEILVHLAELKSLEELHLSNTPICDAGLRHLAALKSLEKLGLNNTRVSDEGLKHLAGLKSLRKLELENTHVSDVGLSHLTELKSLEWLNLGNTHITDAGLKHLASLKSLAELDLAKTQVSDPGLRHLAELQSLRLLGLENTQVSEAGTQRLKHSLPYCQTWGL